MTYQIGCVTLSRRHGDGGAVRGDHVVGAGAGKVGGDQSVELVPLSVIPFFADPVEIDAEAVADTEVPPEDSRVYYIAVVLGVIFDVFSVVPVKDVYRLTAVVDAFGQPVLAISFCVVDIRGGQCGLGGIDTAFQSACFGPLPV